MTSIPPQAQLGQMITGYWTSQARAFKNSSESLATAALWELIEACMIRSRTSGSEIVLPMNSSLLRMSCFCVEQ